jgi:hypothetical protein
MERSSTSIRRTIGGLALFAALALLVAGETALKGRLQNLAFIFYWLTCMALTAIAIGAAFLDVRALQRRTRREQEDLLEATFKEIARRDPAKKKEE